MYFIWNYNVLKGRYTRKSRLQVLVIFYCEEIKKKHDFKTGKETEMIFIIILSPPYFSFLHCKDTLRGMDRIMKQLNLS